MSKTADVVIPIYANVELTCRCIDSVLAHSKGALGKLILVNDCSPAKDMAARIWAYAAEHSDVVVLENEENRGFVSSANRGLSLSERDVVLLNNDTEVTEGWLHEMLAVAYTAPDVAAVVPLSNHATLASVPTFCEGVAPELVRGVPVSDLNPRSVEMPTGVGFCLLLRRTVLNFIGSLDPAYGRGYNEENDWCMRAKEAGFRVLRAQRAMVFHHGSVSFGEERHALDIRNAHLLCHRYPYYLEMNQEFAASPHARLAAHAVTAKLGRLKVEVSENVDAAWKEALAAATSLEKVPSGTGLVRMTQVPDNDEDMHALLAHTGPVLLHLPHLGAFFTPSWHDNAQAFFAHRVRTYWAVHASQRILTDSEFSKQQLVREFFVPPERVEVVKPWLSTATLEAPPTPTAASFVVCVDRHPNEGFYSEVRALLSSRLQTLAPALLQTKGPFSKALFKNARAVVCLDMYPTSTWTVADVFAEGVPLWVKSHTPLEEWVGDAGGVLTQHSALELANILENLVNFPERREVWREAAHRRSRAWTVEKTGITLAKALHQVLHAPDEASLHHRRMLKAAFGHAKATSDTGV